MTDPNGKKYRWQPGFGGVEPTLVDEEGNPVQTTQTPDRTKFGGYGNEVAPDGTIITGTDGASKERKRLQGMAHHPTYETGPQIDQTRANEARGYGNEAMGLLNGAATGTGTSQALILGRRQIADAQNAQQSMANTVRGGPAARAAAARSAAFNASTIGQTGNLQEQAMRAGEMATARGMLFGAASTQRGQDLGAATEQAKLDAQQRAANAQREQYYERMGWDTENARLGAGLGRTAQEQAAANASRAQSIAEDNARWGRNFDAASAIGGTTSGAFGAANATKPQPPPPPPQSSDPYTNSDERMKDAVVPLYEPPGKQLHQSLDGHAFYADESSDDYGGRASLSGPQPLFGRRQSKTASSSSESSTPEPSKMLFGRRQSALEPPKTKAAPGEKRDLAREADKMLFGLRRDHEARMAAGPSVREGEPMANANRSMAPFSYQYKAPFTPSTQGPGERNVGPMANNMAADPVASTAVVRGPGGLLMIDKEKGLKLVMGGLASLQRQVDQLERKKAAPR